MEVTLASGIPARHFLGHGQSQIVLSFPVKSIPQGAKPRRLNASGGKRQRRGRTRPRPYGERAGGQRQGLHGRKIVPYDPPTRK